VRVGSAWLERLASRNIILLGMSIVGFVEQAQVVSRRKANVFQLKAMTPKPHHRAVRSSACRAKC
jgi:hypothetical protein